MKPIAFVIGITAQFIVQILQTICYACDCVGGMINNIEEWCETIINEDVR